MDEGIVSTQELGNRNSAGIGYIFVPRDVDFKTYKNYCLKSNTFSILLDDGGFIRNAKCSKHIIESIEFPDNYDKLGSCVVWVNIPKRNQIVVVSIIDKHDEIFALNTDKVSIGGKNLPSVISLDKVTGNIIISADNVQDYGGNITIKANNKKSIANINIISGNDISSQSKTMTLSMYKKFLLSVRDIDIDENDSFISYEKGVGFDFQDEFDNKIHTEKDLIKFNNGDNKGLAKVEELKNKLNNIENDINELKKILTAWSPVSGDGGAALKALVTNWTSSLITLTSVDDIENKNITH